MQTTLFDLSGKVAVVTGAGAGGGIGHAIALGLAQYGADVAVSDIDDAGAQTTGSEIQALGRRSLVTHCDIAKPEEVTALFQAVDEHFGRIDILVNVPYVFPSRVHPVELRLEDWEKTLSVNLTGYFLCTQEAFRRMVDKWGGGILT